MYKFIILLTVFMFACSSETEFEKCKHNYSERTCEAQQQNEKDLARMQAREKEVANLIAAQAMNQQLRAEAARIDEQLKSTTDVATRWHLEAQKQENEKRQKELAERQKELAELEQAAAPRPKANSNTKGGCPPGDPLCN